MSPDLPPPDQPFTKAELLHRWPAGAEKVEVRRIALAPDGGLIASGREVDRLLDPLGKG